MFLRRKSVFAFACNLLDCACPFEFLMNILTGIIDHRRDLTKNIYEIDIELEEPFSFLPGQFVTLKIPKPEGGFAPRSYSIVSTPELTHTISLCIKCEDMGLGSQYLYREPCGTKVDFFGPYGEFVFHEREQGEVYFIATSTGVAPFMPMLEVYLRKFPRLKFNLIFGVRHVEDIFYQDIFEVHRRNHSNFSYTICVSQREVSYPGFEGRVTDKLDTMTLGTESSFYICGNTVMVSDVCDSLKALKNISESNIFTEKYG